MRCIPCLGLKRSLPNLLDLRPVSVAPLSLARRGYSPDIPERNTVLAHILEAALPDQGDIAGVGGRQAPGKKGRNSIATNYEHPRG